MHAVEATTMIFGFYAALLLFYCWVRLQPDHCRPFTRCIWLLVHGGYKAAMAMEA